MHIEFKITNDPRLFAGLRGAIEHISNQHGLGKADQIEFALAAERECQCKLSAGGSKEAFCEVAIDSFEDRIEIRVVAPANGPVPSASAPLVKHFQSDPARS
ncbi:MAG TPA: hypothetical protein VGR81_01935 [Candidatus Acidoferrales bacterium]|nr:hypothetical protein [Candidatus Acidoferrales bacterium]